MVIFEVPLGVEVDDNDALRVHVAGDLLVTVHEEGGLI